MINFINLETLELIKSVVAIILAYLIIAGIAGAFQAWVAYKAGDDTAAQFGMMTINPFAHVDPMSLWLVPLGYILFRVVIGLGKPVPVLWHNISEPWRRLKIALVALAQPLAILGILVGMLIVQILALLTISMLKAFTILPLEMHVYGYIKQALVGFSVWFIPYQLLMSLAQLYIYEQEKRDKEINYTFVLLIVPLFGAVLLLDISQWALVHFLYGVESGIGWLIKFFFIKASI